MIASIKTTTEFLQPFELAGFNETLPPGEYQIESRADGPVDRVAPGATTSSVLVRLHSRASHPGLDRTLTVPRAELEHAIARDKLTGQALTDRFLEEMLADPMIRLVMQADRVEESELRDLYAARSEAGQQGARETRHVAGANDAKKPGAPGPRPGSSRPGIGE
ncbi:hypothetical protein [Mesobacterium pallidum]|uniref:hypothetical protein n=1 Tax=Mesobacterium pallidum TaxID=2872037 RepID=UPI001EE376EA|nr:hypothetical protein [Mesobacterium pallidum]